MARLPGFEPGLAGISRSQIRLICHIVKKSIVFLLSVTVFASCSKKGEPVPPRDTMAIPQVNQPSGQGAETGSSNRNAARTRPPSADSGADRIVQLPSNSPDAKPPFPIKPPPASQQKSLPIGSMPILTSTQLATLQPTIPGYFKDEKLIFKRDVFGVISKSTFIYRNQADPSQTIRSTLIDQDERAANQILRDITGLRQNGGERTSIDPSGEALTAYLVEVNGAVGASCYIPSKHVATLALVVGDHRMIELREEQATSRDHLIEVAKSYDMKRFEVLH